MPGGTGGAVTAIQRFGSALNTNVHFHTLVAQGVFAERADGTRYFAPAPAPSAREVARLLAAVRRRIIRRIARQGIDLEHPSNEGDAPDERLLECPVYAAIQGAAVLGRVATGARAGGRVARVGGVPAAGAAPVSDTLHAHLDGFDLHAAVAVPAGDRARLEHLCRYVLRPPLAQDALEREPNGTLLLRLRRTLRDGTRAIRFSPIELLEKSAAMIPKPRINLLVYHGAFAPNARMRRDAVRRAHEGAADGACSTPSGSAGSDGASPGNRSTAVNTPAGIPARRSAPDDARGSTPPPADTPPRRGYMRPRHYPWADLLRRTFAIDVLACPACGGRLRFLVTIADPRVIAKILSHLGLPVEVPAPTPAHQAGWWSPGEAAASHSTA
jgi:hypothetical protein